MMAAFAAAQQGHAVTLLEKNEKLGKKLYITGKGRCNLTNATDPEGLLAHVVGNPSFLYSAFYTFGSDDLMRFFETQGVPLKVERGRRVFPVSDKASDIIRAMEKALKAQGVQVLLHHEVLGIAKEEDGPVCGAETRQGFFPADAVIVATGGQSYPATGSTGDGYRFAHALGHSVTPLSPALVPIILEDAWVPALAGLSLRNVALSAPPVFTGQGELLFTHNGLSGPVALTASRYLAQAASLAIDLKPALCPSTLDARLLRDFSASPNKLLENVLPALLPRALVPVILAQTALAETPVNRVTKAQRAALGQAIKNLPLTPVGTAGFREAVVTAGGVNVRELNPKTMASKKVAGLYFAGEVLDVDASTGGYNLQIAFSTGYLAGMGLVEK